VLFLHYDGSVEWQLLYELLSLATLVHSYWLVTNGVANLLVTSILPLGWLRKLLWLQSTWNLVANCIKNGGEWPPQSKYTPTNGIINWNGIIMNGKFIVNVIIILIWVHLQIYCEYECECVYELEYWIRIVNMELKMWWDVHKVDNVNIVDCWVLFKRGKYVAKATEPFQDFSQSPTT